MTGEWQPLPKTIQTARLLLWLVKLTDADDVAARLYPRLHQGR